MTFFTVAYVVGPYSGERTVYAEDEDQAVAKVRDWVKKQLTIPMCSQSYRVVSTKESA